MRRSLIAVVFSFVGFACTSVEPTPASVVVGDAVAPSGAPQPASPAEPLEGAAEPDDSEGDVPAIAAYPPTHIEGLVVRRRGAQVEIIARLGKVAAAKGYDVEVARSLMFTQPVAQTSLPWLSVRLGPMPPGMYFVHARAVGPAGTGPFGEVRVVDAHKSGAAAMLSVAANTDFEEPPIVGPASATAPVQAAAVVTAVVVPVPAAAPADANAVRALQARYQRLQRELAEVEKLRRELQAKTTELQAKLAGSNAESAAMLREELAVIDASRAELDREIASSMAELDRLMQR